MKDRDLSKLLSLVLRHQPEFIGVELDKNGWVSVDSLLEKLQKKAPGTDLERLKQIVLNNDKQRFSFNDELTEIRANQGHSVTVDLDLKAVTPPEFLYHGTVENVMDSIRKEGLTKRSRQHVHLSKDLETAVKVGSRRGKPVILTIRSEVMAQAGYSFFCSENGVWLCDAVPAEFIDFTI
ncbi:RNA 2'-phosphotransferase [compost metagenome]